MRRALGEVVAFVGETLRRCVLHATDTQSAALAFYSLFALAPVLLVVLSVARRYFAEGQARREIVRQLQGVMGPETGSAVAALLEKAAGPGPGADSLGVAAVVVLVLGATAVFIQLQEALNGVWEVAPRPGSVFRSLLRKRLVSFGLILIVGLLLFVSLVLSASLMALTDLLSAEIPLRVAFVTFANEVLSFLVLAVLLGLIYRVLPDANLEWKDVGLGAVVTSLLFSIGKWLIGFYLARTTAASQFGVAGSLVVVLLWVYYESFILLLGAEVTAVYSSRYRHRPVTPAPGATGAGTLPARIVRTSGR
ncbi:MAG: YihY/virulence factor BrkB family protein [Holophagales bacterium]|jgi:membrane protein|nr:YihY/virulence factor BrkB family protein [Holophagales bacterium]MBK9964091.1 YihY/virulence factor BrkB family protein [Holophagales bacterium]